MMHTGKAWYEYCNPPDYHNPHLPLSVLAAQESNWNACNAAQLKYKANIDADEPTPDWVYEAAAKKGKEDLETLETNQLLAFNPTLQLLAEPPSNGNGNGNGDGLPMTLIVGGAVALGLVGLLVFTRPRG
jgi:hypothetical protein